MSTPPFTLRLVSKLHYNEQHFIPFPLSSYPSLTPSSIRIRPRLLGLGSNNLSYCSAGTLLHWWDAFRVPDSFNLPAPYGDRDVYGVAPGWGFGEVIESTIGRLPVGTTIYGFLPLSNHAVDLELQQSKGLQTHWFEISEGRERLMPLYKRYEVMDTSDEIISAYTSTLTWGAGYVLNRFVFASWPGDPVISPMPDRGIPWPKGSEDLTKSLVIALGAGGKTSRSFIQQLATNRREGSGPIGVMEVSSTESTSAKQFQHRGITYDNALNEDTLNWIESLGVNRVVVCDFGSRNNIVERLTLFLRDRLHTKVDLITIGGESKVYTIEEKSARLERNQRLQGTPMNTSGIREVAIEYLGEAKYFEQQSREFQRVVETELMRSQDVLEVKLVWKEGLQGANGLEQAWIDVTEGKVAGSKGLVVRL